MTILANTTRRITFLECPNDLNAMIDVAKTCDLALLLVDASYGFEMETFEFLNCAQVHGFPRIMGVLTHLDKYVKLKKKQSIVYHVKHRFWKEIYNGAKLFVLKGIDKKTDYYYKSDITNLVRFISVLKFRPITWRNNHSYLLCDRFEDLTPPQLLHKYGEKFVNRKIAFYGYVRGCNFKNKSNIHIPGVGDFIAKEIKEMEDPVPTKRHQKDKISANIRVLTKNGKVYAPMANIGPVIFDKDAAYITVKSNAKFAKMEDMKKHSWETEESYIKRLKRESNEQNDDHKLIDIKTGHGKIIVNKLRDKYKSIGIDEKIKKSKLKLFADSKPLSSKDIDQYQLEQEINAIEKVDDNLHVEITNHQNRKRRRVRFDDEVKENNQNGKIELNENAIKWSDVEDHDDDNQDDDIMMLTNNDNDKDNDEDEGKWNEVWLDTPKEKERARKQKEQNRVKLQKQRKDNRGLSSSLNESNTRWKQNLLSNASEIWKTTKTLAQHIYGQIDDAQTQNNNTNDIDDDDDDEFFKIHEPKTMQYNEIDDIDSTVSALSKFNIDDIANSNYMDDADDDDDNDDDLNIKENDRLRNRFVTGDWIEAQKFQSEVEKRAHNVNPDLFDEEIQKDREILEDLGAKTEDNKANEFGEETLDWEFKLEKLMKEKGIEGDISMEDKLAFAQNGIFDKDDIHNNGDNDNDDDENKINRINNISSTMDLEDLQRLEDKIKKKKEFDREFDAGLLEFEKAFDKTGVSTEEQFKIFQKKGDYDKNKKNKRGQGGLKMDDRKNLPGSGKGKYYMDIIREEMAKQNELNIEEFLNETEEQKKELRGYIPGSYIQIIIENIPSEFILNFDLEYPIIIGSLLPQEMQFGFIQCRIKKHRWYKRLLKFNDPLVISSGWRRYQTCPIYCMQDRNNGIAGNQTKLRMIKYTPNYMHCLGIFYGPIIQTNSGILGYVSSSTKISGFRIAAIGNILSSNLSYKIVKKLKLIGEPMEIHKNTVFVKGMFNSNIECSKFIGAKIQTVSGIRGTIKKCEGNKGNFRATFEDRLLKSDLIFLKSWIPIQPLNFYYNVKNLLLNDKQNWNGMKTVGQIKFEKQEKEKKKINSSHFKRDSIYNKFDDLKRNPLKRFNKLNVPKKLENNLPFRLRPKYDRDLRNKKEKHLEKQNYVTKDEKKIQKFVSSLSLIAANHNERQREQKRKIRKRKRKFQSEKLQQERLKKRQRIKKKLSKNQGDEISQFEASRGNMFYKEWRLQKK